LDYLSRRAGGALDSCAKVLCQDISNLTDAMKTFGKKRINKYNAKLLFLEIREMKYNA